MHVTRIIQQAQADGRPRFTVELLPPRKGEGTDGVFATLDPLADYGPACINITAHREEAVEVRHADGHTEHRMVRGRPGTVGIAAAIRARYGVETVPHVICGGRSRYDIEDDLIDMEFLGLDNVLVLRGDAPRGATLFCPHPSGYAHASQLVAQVAAMNCGRFLDAEVAACRPTHFCVGVAGYPEAHAESLSPEDDMEHLRDKVASGAHYIVTQMAFDAERIIGFAHRCRMAGITVPVVPGIKPLSRPEQLELLPRLFHVALPDELVRTVRACRTPAAVRDAGVEWARDEVRQLLRAGFPVVHFYTMGRTEQIIRIVKGLF